MRRFYEMNVNLQCSDDVEAWDDEEDAQWDGCCEDPYEDDEEDDEDNEREWCD